MVEAREVLEQVKAGNISIEEAEKYFRKKPFEELGYAKLDTHRQVRSGFPEVVFCSGKPDEYLVSIYQKLFEANGEVFGTRAGRRQYELVKEVIPQVTYDEVSHILKVEKEGKDRRGKISVCTAGTADIPVAEEAAQTAEYFGSKVERIYDVGVSGIHRLLSRMDVIQEANCVVAVAGMEGALASVIGGLVRQVRSGFPEVVFCSGKPDEYLVSIYQKLFEANGEVFGTRAGRRQYELVKEVIPQVTYDEVSHILKVEKEGKDRRGKISVCTAGTADIPVAEEAAQTAEYFGSKVERIYDVGVSGIHRLLSRMDVIQEANCVVAVAGMEGALASVIGGLVSRPVIAVPTSVGYGASFHGLSALLTMINSCANGIAVVNIDNGYGAGYLATQINRLAYEHDHKEEE